jgi:hypothetical protein
VFPVLGILSCLWLMLNLPVITWVRFLVWLDIGIFIYWFYGRVHSPLADAAERSRRPVAESFGNFVLMAGALMLLNGFFITLMAYMTEFGVTTEVTAKWHESGSRRGRRCPGSRCSGLACSCSSRGCSSGRRPGRVRSSPRSIYYDSIAQPWQVGEGLRSPSSSCSIPAAGTIGSCRSKAARGTRSVDGDNDHDSLAREYISAGIGQIFIFMSRSSSAAVGTVVPTGTTLAIVVEGGLHESSGAACAHAGSGFDHFIRVTRAHRRIIAEPYAQVPFAVI